MPAGFMVKKNCWFVDLLTRQEHYVDELFACWQFAMEDVFVACKNN